MVERISEVAFCERTGVPRLVMKKYRIELQPRVDWELQGRELVLLRPGIQKALAWLNLDENALEDRPTLPVSPPEKKDEHSVLIVEKLTSNNKVVMAWFPNDPPAGVPFSTPDRLVRIRVQDNVNFRRGMRCHCRHVEADLWELIGRCPNGPRDPRFA